MQQLLFYGDWTRCRTKIFVRRSPCLSMKIKTLPEHQGKISRFLCPRFSRLIRAKHFFTQICPCLQEFVEKKASQFANLEIEYINGQMPELMMMNTDREDVVPVSELGVFFHPIDVYFSFFLTYICT